MSELMNEYNEYLTCYIISVSYCREPRVAKGYLHVHNLRQFIDVTDGNVLMHICYVRIDR